MAAHWNKLPPKAKVAAERKPRAAPNRGSWRCAGPRGCGEVVVGSWQSMERHLDTHGGGRADIILEGSTDAVRG
jgi:hypothetical protein